MNEARDFPLSKTNFSYMRKVALDRCGISLSDEKEDALYNRLIRRIRFLGLNNFDQYCQLMQSSIDEESKFINLITNSSTYFFREKHHFEYLGKEILAHLKGNKKIRIWCAGCSTGEEAYSIAMIVAEVMPNFEIEDIKILATDINTDGLSIAKKGIYDVDSIKKLTPQRQKAWFSPVNKKEHHYVKISEKLKKLIEFKSLNLLSIWPMRGHFDVIFCRNVLIYFEHSLASHMLMRFDKLLKSGGFLFLGYSETMPDKLREKYVSFGKTIYKKHDT